MKEVDPAMQPARLVVLASGMGSRLRSKTSPKPLVELGGISGDLNDGIAAATTLLLTGPPGSEIGTAGFARPDQGDGAWLWNLAPLSPVERRVTCVYRGRPEVIDHILASRRLVDPDDPPEVTTVAAKRPSLNRRRSHRTPP
jgi:hypothetical protein